MPVSTDTCLLPDPRHYYEGPSDNPLLKLAIAGETGLAGLRDEMLARIRRGDDCEILEALRCAPSETIYRRLWELVCTSSDAAHGGDEKIIARLFAIPLVLVAGAKTRLVVPGVVPDSDAVCALLQKHGAFGVMRNIGLGNSLSPAKALEGITPGKAHIWSTQMMASGVPHELEACAVVVAAGREQVQLRFLTGAAIVPSGAAPFSESAASIGEWGMPLTRLLSQQLAQPGLELLPIPRPPTAILEAALLGREAELGLSFNLFVSNAVRQFRASVGDPVVIISAHQAEKGGAELRISLSSPFDDTLLEGFRWPLHPADDFERVLAGITGLLLDCRIADVRMLANELPARLSGGAVFVRIADFEDYVFSKPDLAH